MTVGEKLRAARNTAGMTQKQLSDGIVTRNMLSQIENGKASPSVATLRAFADRLNVPASYLLSGEEDDYALLKSSVVIPARQRMKNGEWNGCIELLSRLAGREDDEVSFMLAVCCCRSAFDDYRSGRFVSACNSFETALRHAAATVYPTEWLECVAHTFIDFIDSLNIDGVSGVKNAAAFRIPTDVPDAAALLYIEALRCVETGDINRANILLDSGCLTGAYREHIRAKLMLSSDGEGALALLLTLLGEDISAVMRYSALSDMESVYTERRDFENAYNCSRAKLKLYSEMKINRR